MSAPAKVLWISSVGEKGGAEVYMLNLLRHLDRTRFSPAVALLRPGPLADDLRELDVPAFMFAAHRMRNILQVGRAIGELTGLIRGENFTLVHSNGFRAHVYGGLAARRAKIPAVWTGHTAEKPGLATTVILKIPAAQVVANCPRTAEFFVAHGHATSLIWPGVDPEHLALQATRVELAQRFGLPAAARWVCLGARLQRYKGHAYFLRALAALREEYRDVHGVIIGGALFGMEQDYLAELRALAQSLGLAERVHFTGFISDAEVHGFLAGCELLVHPALDEDFGLSVAEAQALGKPVLAFASVGPSAIIAPEQTGRLVPVGDQARLNTALADLLADPHRLRGWGEAGRERSVRLFGATSAARQQERVYAACLASEHGTTLPT